MSAALTSILLGLATKVAAPFAKKIFADQLGPTAGGIAGALIDLIAGKLGVTVGELPTLAQAEPDKVGAAITSCEPEAADLMLAHVQSQKLSTELQLAEMKSEAPWTWAWRPFWMWLLASFWTFRLIIVPVVDAATGSRMAAMIDINTLWWLTMVYAGFYMGGHTVKALGEMAMETFGVRSVSSR